MARCAELERVVLGDVTAATAAKLADCGQRAGQVVAGARAKREAREEKRRLEEAERERQRPARPAAPAAQQPNMPSTPPSMPPPTTLMIDNNTIAHHQRLARFRATGVAARPQ